MATYKIQKVTRTFGVNKVELVWRKPGTAHHLSIPFLWQSIVVDGSVCHVVMQGLGDQSLGGKDEQSKYRCAKLEAPHLKTFEAVLMPKQRTELLFHFEFMQSAKCLKLSFTLSLCIIVCIMMRTELCNPFVE